MNLPTVVNFAPNGMIPTKDATPHVPISVSEVVEDVLAAHECGISMAHIHARDQKTGVPTYDPDIYARMIEGIRRHAPDLVICASLSGRNFPEFEKRAAPLQLDGDAKPDMGSLTLGSMNFLKQASVNTPEVIKQLAAEMLRRGIAPELEAFDLGMINYAIYLQRQGLIAPPFYFNLLLGNIASAQADMLHAATMVRELPENSLWSLAGLGERQLAMNGLACAMGGGVRTGLEDNIYFDKSRTTLATNLDLVTRIKQLSELNDRDIMTPSDLRRQLKLEPGHGRYGRRYPDRKEATEN
ncbi:MAG: 3-keto-5-aminohexanoate cleavage protein [Pseudomonadota bacterium]